jgi:hypothetical protein
MNKGVEGPLPDSARGIPDARVATHPAGSEERVIRRRRRHHRRHQNLTHRTGRTKEIAVVTLLALAILFGILYYLLPHYQGRSDDSSEAPATTAPSSPGTRVGHAWPRPAADRPARPV